MKLGRIVGGTLSPSEPAVSPLSGANAAIYTRALTRGSAPASVMTDPPHECPTRTTSPSARSISLLVAATSSSRDVVGFCTEITLYPSSISGLITLLQQEPSAQSPWTKTIVSFWVIESPVCATALEPRNRTPATIPASRVLVIFFIVFLLTEFGYCLLIFLNFGVAGTLLGWYVAESRHSQRPSRARSASDLSACLAGSHGIEILHRSQPPSIAI